MISGIPSAKKDPHLGRLLARRYQLEELIGAGAMGKVYRANDTILGGVPVAVKFLALSSQNQKIRLRERFEQEAKTCALLGQKSIHIVRVLDYGVDDLGIPYYVMEYLQGDNFSSIIYQQSLSLARFFSLVRQISLGLQCAHQGIPVDGQIYPIVHRDIKPNNILVVQDTSFGELVKILDFGIAKLLQTDSNQTNCYLGTLAYSSPEQIEGNELDNRADIYSLGVMMFEMLTGKMPFQVDNHSFGGWYKAHQLQQPRTFAAVAPALQVPDSVENLVMSCLAKKPSDRPQSIGEILATLTSLEQDTQRSADRQRSGCATKVQAQEATTDRGPVLEVKSPEPSPLLKAEHQKTFWPKNKPIANIVFPHPIRTNEQMLAGLWVMLPQQEIQRRLQNTSYNQFLFIKYPHPMMLWITVIYSRKHGAKWFPCYLDMKTSQGQEITRLLWEAGCYRLLLFAREAPLSPGACLPSLTIAPAQCQRLQEWARTSQTLIPTAEPQRSKSLLKNEFEKIKPQILLKLEGSFQLP